MKKILLACVATLLLAVPSFAQVVITEISYNPPESGVDSLEYVELYNNSNVQVDVSGWKFSKGFAYTFPSGTILSPGEYVVISKTEQTFFNIFGFKPLVWDVGGALTNSGETIALVNASDILIDSVAYTNMAPWPLGANGQGSSLVLCDPNADNNVGTNWIAATTGTGKIVNNFEVKGNPGAASGCPSVVTATNDNAVVPTGGSVTTNVVANDFVPGTLGTVTIITPPTKGTALVNADKTITYTSTAGNCGADSYKYRVCNTANQCAEATVNIVVVCFPLRTIAEMTTENANGVADSLNKSCTVIGTVNITNLRASTTGTQFTIQDNAAGVMVFNTTKTFGYTPTINDRISVSGTIGQFNGLTQLLADTIIKLPNTQMLTPVTVMRPNEDTESELITINRVLRLAQPSQWTTGMGTGGFTVNAVDVSSPTDTIVIRVDNDITNVYNAPAPTGSFRLTGICTQFDTSDPFTSGYQVLPRSLQDLTVNLYEPLEVEVSITPNPATDLLRIQMDTQIDRLTVTNILGAVVTQLDTPAQNTHIDCAAWASGVYTITLWKGPQSKTVKIVK